MGDFYDQVPDKIKDHLKQLVKTAGLEDSDDSLESIAQGWLEKKTIFEDEIEKQEMEEIDEGDQNDENGFLVMTYSGSLLNIGPLIDGVRKVNYSSIGMRQDVPEKAEKEGSAIEGGLSVDEQVSFSNGPVQKSSPIFKIAIVKEELPPEEEEEKLSMATQVLTENFIEVNKTIIAE